MVSRSRPLNILFDFDGTLSDSLPGIEYSVRAAFAACSRPLRHPNLRPFIGPPIREILARAGEVVDTADLDRLERAFRHSYDSEGWRMAVCFPGAAEALRELRRRGCNLFLVTNKPQHITRAILEQEGLTALFDEIVTRDSHSPAYPDKEAMLRAVVLSHKLGSDSCLMVGDTMEDAIAAASAGIRMVWMAHGYGILSEPQPEAVTAVLSGFSQLQKFVAEVPGDD
ncbi:MAG TPA: HAD family hydrolase [Acidobacteriaceae bacterium]|nr:HAD family hydrolase [Acidobacteriaceae bacterium]